jgi:hypothetical protein
MRPEMVAEEADNPLVTAKEVIADAPLDSVPVWVRPDTVKAPELLMFPLESVPLCVSPETVTDAAAMDLLTCKLSIVATPLVVSVEALMELADNPFTMAAELALRAPAMAADPAVIRPVSSAVADWMSEATRVAVVVVPDTFAVVALIEELLNAPAIEADPAVIFPVNSAVVAWTSDAVIKPVNTALPEEMVPVESAPEILPLLAAICPDVRSDPAEMAPDASTDAAERAPDATTDAAEMAPDASSDPAVSTPAIAAVPAVMPPFRTLKFLVGTSNTTSSPSDAEMSREL